MSPELDKRIPAALLILRFFLAIFLLQWSIEKLILPDAAVASGHATLATKRTLLLELGPDLHRLDRASFAWRLHSLDHLVGAGE
jgi:hypothetical protein